MTPKMAAGGVLTILAVMAILMVFHQQFKPEARTVSKIEEVRRSDPLPPAAVKEDVFADAKKVRTTIFKKPLASESLASPTPLAEMKTDPVPKPLVNEDAHPIKAETLPSQVQQQTWKPVPVARPQQVQQRNDDDDEPKHRSSDGVCGKYGGHKVTFHKRSGWESWRCVYPHRR